jgi:hypothetical protein
MTETTQEPKQIQHAAVDGHPCTRCGIKYSQKTAYIPCFVEGDTLKTWVARNADTLLAAGDAVPSLLREMATEAKETKAS